MNKIIIGIFKNKNFNNSFWSALDVVLYPLFFILTTPFFIQELGTELFGIWLLMTSINVSLQVFNFGIGSALIFYTAHYISRNNITKLYKIYNSILSLSIVLLPLIGFLAFLISQIFIQTSFFKVPLVYKTLAIKGVYLSAIISVFKIVQTILMSILNGKEIYVFNTVVNTISRILILLVGVVLVILDYGVLEILIFSVFINLLAVLIYYIGVKRHFKAYRFKIEFQWSYVQEIFTYGFWIWIQGIFSMVSFQIDKFFVTAISGPSLLVYYSLSSTIVNQLHMVFSALSAWLFPRISRLMAMGKDFISIYVSVRSLVLSLAYLSIFILFLIKEPLLNTWIGKENSSIMLPIFKLFLVYEIIYAQTVLPSFLLQGMKKVKIATVYTICYKVVLIINMTIAYFQEHSVEKLLMYMAFSLYFVLPILHYYINKKSTNRSSIFESIYIFIPTYLLASIILIENTQIKVVLSTIFAGSIYIVYLKQLNFQKLKEVDLG